MKTVLRSRCEREATFLGQTTRSSVLIGGQQRADVFHRAFETALDLDRDFAQLVVVLLELAEAPGELVRPRGLRGQSLLDHRLQPAERSIDAILGIGCLGHCPPAGGSQLVGQLRTLHGAEDSWSRRERSTYCPCGASLPAISWNFARFCALTQIGVAVML